MPSAVKEGKYLYCIIDSGEPRSFGPLGIGGRGDELRAVCFNDISCIASNSQIERYPASRENIISHEKAIEKVMKKHAVLPVRFATIAESEEKIKKILEKEYDNFKNLLNSIRGKKELGFKAVFKENIYAYILQSYEAIRTLKRKITTLYPEKAYYQRMEIGRMVEQALEGEKKEYKAKILETLKPIADDIRINSTYGERMILNAAFLAEKSKETEFDRQVQELDCKYGDRINFKYVGIVPPFNFVNLAIDTSKTGNR